MGLVAPGQQTQYGEKSGLSNLFGLTWTGSAGTPELGLSEGVWGRDNPNVGTSVQNSSLGLRDTTGQNNNVVVNPSVASIQKQATTTAPANAKSRTWKNGEWSGSKQYWDGNWYEGGYKQPTGDNNGGGGNGGGGSSEPDYNSMYAPMLQYLSETEGLLGRQKESDLADLDAQESATLRDYGTEEANLYKQNETSQTDFNKTLRSALEEALRGYNALNQQNVARFGGGSSAGGAVGELAQQEFLRQQGKIGESGVEGNAKFEAQKGDIGQFISDKKLKLKEWKNQALRSIQDNYLAKLNDINGKRYEVEANKTRDKINNLLDMRARVDSLRQADTQFRQNLAVAAVNQLQQVSNKAFTPKEIKAYISEFMSDLPSYVASSGTGYTNLARKPGQTQDDWSQVTYS